MKKYKFEEFAINCTKKRTPTPEDYPLYIGLEHMDTKCIRVTRWGSSVPIKGDKLIMQKGDVLLGKRNAYLRRAAIAPHDGLFSAHGMVLKPKEKIVDKDFFALFVASDYFFDAAIRISVGSLSPTINWSDLKNLEFWLPSLEEQKRIAEVLWSINNTKDSYKNMIEATKKLLEAYFCKMFGDPTDDNTKKHSLLRLKDIFEKPQAGEWGSDDDTGNGVPVLRTTNFTDEGIIDFTEVVTRNIDRSKVDKKSIKFGDILMEKSGGSTDKPVGRVVLYEDEDGKYLNNNFTAVLRLLDKFRLNYIYVFYFMYLNYWFNGTSDYENKTTGIHNINLDMFLENTKIPYASEEEQKTFVDLFNKVKKSNDCFKSEINHLDEMYKTIITNCLTNKEE